MQVISIHPGSILHNKKVSAIVYDELVRRFTFTSASELILPSTGHDEQDVREGSVVDSALVVADQGAFLPSAFLLQY